ncbi:discoidin domain-containing protein [Lewinella sp. IMCC34183]|uniref:discoidin domain-containing protein n=1 Tax=Lewinella sp. IMCC34183 TaxID=2248762 RepID=UPI000E227E59|nr:discoidin domain-containing protein [Lewinella sp. IMCC34183]
MSNLIRGLFAGQYRQVICILVVALLPYTSVATAQGTANLALNREILASSEINGNLAALAVDGNPSDTRWESVVKVDPQWIQVDLGATQRISRVRLAWEGAYGKDYQIQVSDDAGTWQTIQTVTGNTALDNDLTGLTGEGRYVRMYGTARGTEFGYSLWEFEVYGDASAPDVSLTAPASGTVVTLPDTITLTASATAKDGKTITKVDFYSGDAYLGSTTTAPFSYTWPDAPAGTHTLTARATDSDGLLTVSTPVRISVNAVNVALNAPATASSSEKPAAFAFDGNPATRWESVHDVDPQWIYVDLGEEYTIDRVKLTWERAYAGNYRIDLSNNAVDWTTIASGTNNSGLGNNLVNDLNHLTGSGRYVRMYGTTRASNSFGYSLYEFEVYGSQGANVITAPVAGSTYTAPGTLDVEITGSAAGNDVSRIELLVDDGVVDTRTAAPFDYTVAVTDLPAGNYELHARIYHQDESVTVSSTVHVYVVPATTGAYSCGEPVTLSAAGTPDGGTYRWYTVPMGGTPIASETAAEYTTPPVDVTRTYYVAAVSPQQQESQRAPVTASSNKLAQANTTGLTSSYPFHGNATDATGKGNTGIVNGATLTADRFGKANSAYNFDGVDDFITTSTSFPTDIEGTNIFSLSVWFNTTTTQGGKMLGLGTNQYQASGQYDRHIYMTNDGRVVFGIFIDTHRIIATDDSYNDGAWHNAVAILSPSGIRLYIDGVLQASDATVTEGEKYTVPGYWRIGYDNLAGWPDQPTSHHFQGALDDINIYYSTEITADDLTSLYGASVRPVSAGETIELKANYREGVSYSWTGPAGFTSTEQNPTIPDATLDNAGDYTVTSSNGTCTSDPVTVAAVVSAAAVLPTALLSFRAEQVNGRVALRWTTASETNNRGFEVERSADGNFFRPIGFVAGAGDSRNLLAYTYADDAPGTGVVYYRLRQVDFDGGAIYSGIVTVRSTAPESFSIHPNPVRTALTLTYDGAVAGTATFTLTDARGQVVLTGPLEGGGKIPHRLDMERCVPGLYWLTLRREGKVIHQSRVAKQ